MSQPIRILLVTLDYPPPPGGIQTIVKNLDEGLKEAGHQCEVLHIDRSDYSPKPSDLLPRHRWLYGSESVWTLDYAYLQAVYTRTQKAINEFNPDVVHAMHVKDWSALVAAKEAGLPSVLSTYALELRNRPLAVRAIRDADVVHCLSEFTESLVLERTNNPEATETTVIPPSIRISGYREATERSHLNQSSDLGPVVTLARFVDRKNIETVVRAWDELESSVRRGRQLVVAGDGPNRDRLEQIVGDRDDVRFPGWITGAEKRELLADADAFAMVPRRDGYDVEGFGIVYIEAQAAQTPVIGSRHGGAPEAIDGAGIVVDDEDDPSEVAEAMDILLTDDELRDECLQAAEDRIDQFDVPVVARSHAEIYESLSPSNSTLNSGGNPAECK